MLSNTTSDTNAPGIYAVEAGVHKPVNNGFRVKASILGVGMYINGMMVYPPGNEHDAWTVYPPAKRAGKGKYAYIVEFDKHCSMWSEVSDACISAVQAYMAEGQITESEVVHEVTDLPHIKPTSKPDIDVVIPVDDDTPIDLRDVPF